MIPLRDLNRVERAPLVTYALIAINLAVFLYQLTLDDFEGRRFLAQYGVVPYMLTEDFHVASLSTPFYAMFIHGGWWHLLSNMWFLHIFGDNVEDAMGRIRFLLFYLAAGLCASLAHVFVGPSSQLPMVGASGAIAGVLGAYLRLFPRNRLLTLIPIFFFAFIRELPAPFFIGVWFLLQLLNGFGSLGYASSIGGVAFFAHIGGFAAGLWLLGLFGVRRNTTQGFRSSHPSDRSRSGWGG